MPWGSTAFVFLLGLVGCWIFMEILTSAACIALSTRVGCAPWNLQTDWRRQFLLFSHWRSALSRVQKDGFSWTKPSRFVPLQRTQRGPGLHVTNCTAAQRFPGSTRLSSVPDAATAGHSLWDECTNPLLAQVDRFVLFGDLHISEATLPTCLDALSLVQHSCKRHTTFVRTASRKVHDPPSGEGNLKTQELPAAAVFLGDFWHSRIERNLHWGLLRPVLEFWEQWDVPVSPTCIYIIRMSRIYIVF